MLRNATLNSTNDGLHITSMTGSWLAIVQGFAGMRVIDDELQFSPFVPKDWEGYNFRINFRDRLLEVTVNKEGSSIKLLKGDDLTIKLNGESLTLTTEKQVNSLKGVVFEAWSQLAKEKFDLTLPAEFESKLKGISRIESLERILEFGNLSDKYTSDQVAEMANEKNTYYVAAIDSQLTENDILPGVKRLLDELKEHDMKLARYLYCRC